MNPSGSRGRRDNKSIAEYTATKKKAMDLADKLGLLTIKDGRTNEVQVEESVENSLPKNVLYYGWFFNPEISTGIKGIAEEYLQSCLKVPQFQRFLANSCTLHNVRDAETFYRHPRAAKHKEDFQYHVTAKFLDREPHLQYSTLAKEFTGQVFDIHLTDMFFTEKSCGIRVALTPDQKILFDERDGGDQTNIKVATTNSCSDEPPSSRYLLRSSSKKSVPPAEEQALQPDENQQQVKKTIKTTQSSSSSKKICKSKDHNSNNQPSGLRFVEHAHNDDALLVKSRAHITIGCGPRIKPVQTGIDILELVDLERRVKLGTIFTQDYPLEGGTLRQFGHKGDAFAFYPCHKIVADAVFNYYI